MMVHDIIYKNNDREGQNFSMFLKARSRLRLMKAFFLLISKIASKSEFIKAALTKLMKCSIPLF